MLVYVWYFIPRPFCSNVAISTLRPLTYIRVLTCSYPSQVPTQPPPSPCLSPCVKETHDGEQQTAGTPNPVCHTELVAAALGPGWSDCLWGVLIVIKYHGTEARLDYSHLLWQKLYANSVKTKQLIGFNLNEKVHFIEYA